MNGINYKKGFTLIEVLIAIGILSIVLLSVYGTFFSVNRAVRFADSRVYRLREIRIFFDMIRKEIESAYLDPKDSRTFFGIKDRDIFGVQASELKFTSFVPYSAGLHYVEYGLDRKKLTLNKKIGVPWEAGTPEKVAVLNDVMGFKVETDNSGRSEEHTSELQSH